MTGTQGKVFKQTNYLRMERWNDSATMKRFLKRARHKAQRRDGKYMVNED